LKTFNAKTQVQLNVSKVGLREGVELGWSQTFGLDELDGATLLNHDTTNATLTKVM
jgi:hypothetical protein